MQIIILNNIGNITTTTTTTPTTSSTSTTTNTTTSNITTSTFIIALFIILSQLWPPLPITMVVRMMTTERYNKIDNAEFSCGLNNRRL